MRWLGAGLILVGCVIIAIDVYPIDVVVVGLAPSHGIHASDLIGTGIAVAGIAVLWRRRR
jgi:hypothetical protein